MCYDSLAARPGCQQELVERALQDWLMGVRLWGLKRLEGLPTPAKLVHLRRLLCDKSSRVRVAAIRTIPDELWGSLEQEVVPMLWDDSRSIREAARFYLRARGIGDFCSRCLDALQSRRDATTGLVSCLCETGGEEHFDLVRPYASHPKARVREAAVAGLGRLKAGRATEVAVRALCDSNGRVRRAAVAVLRRDPSAEVRQKALEVLEHGARPARLAALRLLASLGGWEAGRDIVGVLADADVAIRDEAWKAITRWGTCAAVTLYARPPVELADELRRLVACVPEPAVNEYARRDTWRRMLALVDWAIRRQ
jgi:HEAT repeat protein